MKASPHRPRMLLVWHEAGNPLYADRFHALAAHYQLTVFGFKNFQGVEFPEPLQGGGGTNSFELKLFKPIFSRHWLTVFSPALVRAARRGRFDIVYIHQEPHSMLAALLSAVCHDSRIFLDAAVINRRLNFGGANLLERYVYHRAEAFFYRNDDVRDVLASRGCPHQKLLARLGNGVSTRTFHDIGVEARELLANFPRTSKYVIGYAGRIWKWKGVAVLGKIAQMPGVSVVACGPVWDKELAQELVEHGVVLYPKLGKSDLVAFYSAIDLFILPSIPSPNWTEQFGRVVVESVFCGTPAIGSSAGFIPELVGKEQVFDALSPEQVIRLVERLRDPARRNRLLADQQCRLSEEYSWEGIASSVRAYVSPSGGPGLEVRP
jgi:glycosyltransferase involved in cell wall biosynthesis